MKAKVSGGLDEVAFLVSVDLVHVAFSLMARLALTGAASDSEPSLVGDHDWPTQVFAEVLLQARDGVLGSSNIDSHTIHDFHIEPLNMDADQVSPWRLVVLAYGEVSEPEPLLGFVVLLPAEGRTFGVGFGLVGVVLAARSSGTRAE